MTGFVRRVCRGYSAHLVGDDGRVSIESNKLPRFLHQEKLVSNRNHTNLFTLRADGGSSQASEINQGQSSKARDPVDQEAWLRLAEDFIALA